MTKFQTLFVSLIMLLAGTIAPTISNAGVIYQSIDDLTAQPFGTQYFCSGCSTIPTAVQSKVINFFTLANDASITEVHFVTGSRQAFSGLGQTVSVEIWLGCETYRLSLRRMYHLH